MADGPVRMHLRIHSSHEDILVCSMFHILLLEQIFLFDLRDRSPSTFEWLLMSIRRPLDPFSQSSSSLMCAVM